MLDPQTRQQLQTKFQQVKPQLKQRFSGVTDQDLDAWRNDPEQADHDDQPEDGSADGPRRGSRSASWWAPPNPTPSAPAYPAGAAPVRR